MYAKYERLWTRTPFWEVFSVKWKTQSHWIDRKAGTHPYLSLKGSHLLITSVKERPSCFGLIFPTHKEASLALAALLLHLGRRCSWFSRPPRLDAKESKLTTSCNLLHLNGSKNGLTYFHREEHLRCSDQNAGGKSFCIMSDEPILPPMSRRFVREPIRLRDVTSGLANWRSKNIKIEKCRVN